MPKNILEDNSGKNSERAGRQSVDRGLEIMQLLARNGAMTASAIGDALGVGQSSASRILQSFIKAGFVRKPTFHSFSLDYGVLYFAGLAMDQFPLVPAATRVCNDVHVATGYGAMVAIMPGERLLYLARVHEQPEARFRILDDSSWPIHGSSLGLALSHDRGQAEMQTIIEASLLKHGASKMNARKESRGLWTAVEKSTKSLGFFYIENMLANRTNGAMVFEVDGQRCAMAVFSEKYCIEKEYVSEILRSSILQIEDEMEKGYSR